ncbi:MAG: hypothetical protein ACMUHM_08705 [Thermoplasmatota archaeon]
MKRKGLLRTISIPLIIIAVSTFFPGCVEKNDESIPNSSYYFHFSGQKGSFAIVPVILKSNGNSLFTENYFKEGSWDNLQTCLIDGHLMWNVSESAYFSFKGDMQIDDPEGLDMSWEVGGQGQNVNVRIYYSGGAEGRLDFRFDHDTGNNKYGFYFYSHDVYPGWNVYTVSDF